MNTTTTSSIRTSRHSNPAASAVGPLVFQYETPHGHRYHVAGGGFNAENIRAATRYPVNASWRNVLLDPFVPDGGHLTAYALVEISSIEDTAIRASWGGRALVLSPTNFHAEAFATIRPLLDGFVTSGGTPFGSTLTVSEPNGTKRRGAIFNVGFQLPTGVEELLTPLSPFGARTPREILSRLDLLGFRLKGRSGPQGFSIWQRKLRDHVLLLETGFACAPATVTLLVEKTQPLVTTLTGRTFTEIHPLLASFIAVTKSASPAQVLETFRETFVNPSAGPLTDR